MKNAKIEIPLFGIEQQLTEEMNLNIRFKFCKKIV